jgi:hypothetical protein
MPVRVEIKGTEEFRRTAAKLKEAGRGDLVRELAKGMRTEAKPAVEDAQRAVRAIASSGSRGGGGQQRRAYTVSRARKVTEATHWRAFRHRGLRDSAARATKAEVRTGGRSARVRIRVNARQMPRDQRLLPGHMDTGKWRHPVMGNREVWVTQTTTPPGWFTRTVPRHGPKIRRGGEKVMDRVLQRLAD